MNKLISEQFYPGYYTNELTSMLDEILEQRLRNKGLTRMCNHYIMEHSKMGCETVYAIRYPGATRGSIVTNLAGKIVEIGLDKDFYGEHAEVEKFIGYQLVLEG